jgi:porphobilinogen deaminase
LRELGADCKTPVGVYCTIQNNQLDLKTIIFDFDGKEIFETKSSTRLRPTTRKRYLSDTPRSIKFYNRN